MRKRQMLILSILMVVTLLFTACSGSSTPANKDSSTPASKESSSTTPAPKDKIVMKISHVSAPGSARDLASHKVKEIVEQMTNGRVQAQVYPASQLGGQRDQVEGVQFGTIEMSVVPTAYLGGTQPLMTLLDTPFLLPEDPEKLYKLYQSDAMRELFDTTKEKDIITLAIWQTGYKQYTANKPLLDPADAKGMKVRVMNSPILFEAAKTIGLSPITMDFGETYGALQNKAIDGQDNPIDTIYDMKFHEVQSDITLTNHSTLDQMVIVNKAWFEGLDKEVQDAIVEGVKQAGRVCLESTIELIKKDTEIILATGKTKIHELTPEQKAKWKAALLPVQEFARKSQGDRGAKLYDMIANESKKLIEEK